MLKFVTYDIKPETEADEVNNMLKNYNVAFMFLVVVNEFLKRLWVAVRLPDAPDNNISLN